jgi:hypothetical protein
LPFSTGLINLGFLLRENLLLCSSYLSLGVSNWVVICPHQATFFGTVAEEKEDFCKRSFARTTFTLLFVLLYFISACIFLSKTQKN